jgi:hypothetical protein
MKRLLFLVTIDRSIDPTYVHICTANAAPSHEHQRAAFVSHALATCRFGVNTGQYCFRSTCLFANHRSIDRSMVSGHASGRACCALVDLQVRMDATSRDCGDEDDRRPSLGEFDT